MTPRDGSGLPDGAFRTILDTLSLPVLVVTGDGTIRYAGGSIERDFGYRPDEVLGRNILEFTPPDQVESALQSMADLLRYQEIGLGVPVVYGVIRPDQSLTWSAVGAVPLLEDPDVEGITLYFLPWDSQLHFDESLSALLAGEPIDVVFETLGRSIAIALEAIGASIHYGFDGLRFAAATGAGVPKPCFDDDGPWLEAVRTATSRYVSIADLPEGAAAAAAAVGVRGCWCIPLPPTAGVEPAVLTVWRPVAADPVTAHAFVVTRSLRYVQLALQRWFEHEQLAHMANHDPLTGVANRGLFRDHLAAAVEGQAPAAVLYCDLDRFKSVNDTLGHAAGDLVLVEVAQRLRLALRAGDLLARLGGDEFTVLLRGDAAVARTVADRMVAMISEPFAVGESTVSLGLSVGIALSGPGATVDSMLGAADTALYEAKRHGGGIRVA